MEDSKLSDLFTISAVDIKNKMLIIQSDEAVTADTLVKIRNKVVQLGGLGVLYLPTMASIKAESLDSCIAHLQLMKIQAKTWNLPIITTQDLGNVIIGKEVLEDDKSD